jgi:DNA-damage-inducible protein J
LWQDWKLFHICGINSSYQECFQLAGLRAAATPRYQIFSDIFIQLFLLLVQRRKLDIRFFRFYSGNNLVPTQFLGYNVAQRGNIMLATHNSVVRARIDGDIKIEAEAVLASIGLTASDAFRMLMMRIAKEKQLPFAPLIPNEETIEAMRAARRGELVTVGSADNLLEMLNAGD